MSWLDEWLGCGRTITIRQAQLAEISGWPGNGIIGFIGDWRWGQLPPAGWMNGGAGVICSCLRVWCPQTQSTRTKPCLVRCEPSSAHCSQLEQNNPLVSGDNSYHCFGQFCLIHTFIHYVKTILNIIYTDIVYVLNIQRWLKKKT